MAVRISLSGEDDLSFPEQDVVVKQKPTAVRMTTASESDTPPATSPMAAIGSKNVRYSPNGGVPALEVMCYDEETPVTLEAAVDRPLGGSQTSGSERSSRSPMLWSSRSEFGLSGTFSVAGRNCIVTVEEDQLQWIPEKKGRRGL